MFTTWILSLAIVGQSQIQSFPVQQTGKTLPPPIATFPAPVGQPISPIPDDVKLRVFPLKYCEPAEVRQILDELLGGPIQRLPLLQPDESGDRLIPVATTPTYFAIDKRTRSIIVRGPKKTRQLAADLVQILDVTEGEAPPKLKINDFSFIKLKHLSPKTLARLANEVGLDVSIVTMTKAKALFARGNDATMYDLRELIQALDRQVERVPEGLRRKLLDTEEWKRPGLIPEFPK